MTVLGVDLGTSHCCLAVADANGARVLRTRSGRRTIPAIVAQDANGRLVAGEAAERVLRRTPDHAVVGLKRLIEHAYDTPEVRQARRRMPRVFHPGHEDVELTLGRRVLSVPDALAVLLSELRGQAAYALGRPPTHAVIAVPAHFTGAQRSTVRRAADVAGLEVIAMPSEPVAAIVGAQLDRRDETIAVFDLGAGGLDVSILQARRGHRPRVLGSAGDALLGGGELDERLMDLLIRRCRATHDVDPAASIHDLARLRSAAREARHVLSTDAEAAVDLASLARSAGGPVHLQEIVTRRALEDATQDLIRRAVECGEEALAVAELAPRAIDRVLLVGGVTRTPAIRDAVTELFGAAPLADGDPDEVVALGAASIGHASVARDADSRQVTAHALGIMGVRDTFQVLIPAGTTVPVQVTRALTTQRSGQTRLSLVVLQGEHPIASENEPVRMVTVRELPPRPSGDVIVEVCFAIDDSGLLDVSARIAPGGASLPVTIDECTASSATHSRAGTSPGHEMGDWRPRAHEGPPELEAAAALRHAVTALSEEIATRLTELDPAADRTWVDEVQVQLAEAHWLVTRAPHTHLAGILVGLERIRAELARRRLTSDARPQDPGAWAESRTEHDDVVARS